MSDEPKDIADLITDAINAAVANVIGADGGIITGFISFTTYIDSDSDLSWVMSVGEGQNLIHSMGMAKLLDIKIRNQVRDSYFETEDED